MNPANHIGRSLLAPLSALPEEFTLAQVQALVAALPSAGASGPRGSWFKYRLNLLVLAILGTVAACLFLARGGAPLADVPGAAHDPENLHRPNLEPARGRASVLSTDTASPDRQNGRPDASSADASHQGYRAGNDLARGMDQPGAGPHASDPPPAHWRASSSGGTPVARQEHGRNKPRQMDLLTTIPTAAVRPPAAPLATTSSPGYFQVVLHAWDRRTITYVCADADGGSPAAGVPALTVRVDVVSAGGYNWHIVGGTAPFTVLASGVDPAGNACVRVQDAEGQLSTACGMIGTMNEIRAIHCAFSRPDTNSFKALHKHGSAPGHGAVGTAPVSPPRQPDPPPPARKDPSPLPSPPRGPDPTKPQDPYRPPVRVVLTDPDPPPPPPGPVGRNPSVPDPRNTPLHPPGTMNGGHRDPAIQRPALMPSPVTHGGKPSPSPQPRPSPAPAAPAKGKAW